MMLNPLYPAKYFIIKAYSDGLGAQMTNMKLQKLLYYAQSIYLALHDEPLFSDEIQAWRYGPVCPAAYQFYREFEADQLPIPQLSTIEILDAETQKVLDEVWEYFGSYNAYSLSDMSHMELPWQKARRGLPPDAASRNPIPLEDLRSLGERKLDSIEREHPAYSIVIEDALKNALADQSTVRIEKGGVRDWLESILD
jgi:uncharacterized phage-associated protein